LAWVKQRTEICWPHHCANRALKNDHAARRIVNANHDIIRVAVEFGVIDYIADRKGPRLFSPR
jgi:hypothetical protein